MDALENLFTRITKLYEHCAHTPFPYDDIRSLHEVFEAEFGRLAPHDIFTADLNLFCSTIHGWASGGFNKVLPDAGDRYRVKTWLTKSFFNRFPQYGFLEVYDLSEYPALKQEMDVADQLRCMLLEAIRLYETRNATTSG